MEEHSLGKILQGQGWGFERPGLVGGIPAHGKGVGTTWSVRSLPIQTILWLFISKRAEFLMAWKSMGGVWGFGGEGGVLFLKTIYFWNCVILFLHTLREIRWNRLHNTVKGLIYIFINTISIIEKNIFCSVDFSMSSIRLQCDCNASSFTTERYSAVLKKSALLNADELFDSLNSCIISQWYYFQQNLIKLIL